MKVVAPLRKQKPDGSLYSRPAEVVEQIEAILKVPIDDVVERARIHDEKDASYVRSECLVHLVRQSKANRDAEPYKQLFLILQGRIDRAVPLFERNSAGGKGVYQTDLEIREQVCDRFVELLCRDREGYEERLDFYEIRFNRAVALLRSTARRDIGRAATKHLSLSFDEDTVSPTEEMTEAFERLRGVTGENPEEILYRNRFYAAINDLPPEQRQVIELMRQGVPIETSDKDALSIAKTLKCVEKTVRNRRNRAFEAIKKAMQGEVDV